MSLSNVKRSTLITFQNGATSGTSKVVAARELDHDSRKALLLVEETPFHPLDYGWPDQPPDSGIIVIRGVALPVIDAWVGAMDTASGQLYLDKDIPLKKGGIDLLFLVAHIVVFPEKFPITEISGETAELLVDSQRRKNLSAAHSACHLMALALNKYARKFWKKEAPKDSLGNPDTDQQSIQSSKITEKESLDHYRFGKSLRKAGFESLVLVDQLKDLESSVNEQLSIWLKSGSEIYMETADSTATIDSRRAWRCRLPDGEVSIPCGGTHLNSLRELKSVSVSFEPVPACPEIKAHTVPILNEDLHMPSLMENDSENRL